VTASTRESSAAPSAPAEASNFASSRPDLDSKRRVPGVLRRTQDWRPACYNTNDCTTATDYIRWTYNDLGHRLTETRPAGTTTYTYNDKDQLVETAGPSDTTTYAYDANGNQTRSRAQTATHNAAGQITSCTSAGTSTAYSYDGDGRRLSASTGTSSTQFLWIPQATTSPSNAASSGATPTASTGPA